MVSVGTSPTSLDCGWSEDQNDIAAGELSSAEAFHEQALDESSPDNKQCKTGKRKSHSGAAGEFVTDVERAGRSGEKDKCE